MLSSLLPVIRKRIKSFLNIESYLYQLLKAIYYKIKKIFDFIIFKIRNPRAYWIYNYKKNQYSNSQYGQDKYILDVMGSCRKYVEVGANHPIRLNNSFLLEQHQWLGISIDPLAKYQKEWDNLRTQPFINCAIGREKGTKKFIEFYGSQIWSDMLSGFKDFVRDEDLVTFSNKQYDVQVKLLNDILPFEKFDLLLVDVEGAEMEVLEGIDLQFYAPKFVLLENASKLGGCHYLREYMNKQGYSIFARLGCADDFFRRN